jgi:hypothetical protein
MIGTPVGFDFARTVNSVPLVLAEFAQAGLEYPIVFAGQPGDELPAVLLGLTAGDNLFVEGDGGWAVGSYVPAFIRRYPFVLAEQAGGEDFTVCIDEAFPGLGETDGEPLFNADGSDGPVLRHAIAFLTDFQEGLKATRAFTARVRELGLLEAKTVRIEPAQGEPSVLQGLSVVSEERLRALKGKPLQGLLASGELAAIHAHLQSLNNIGRLGARMDRRQPKRTH